MTDESNGESGFEFVDKKSDDFEGNPTSATKTPGLILFYCNAHNSNFKHHSILILFLMNFTELLFINVVLFSYRHTY